MNLPPLQDDLRAHLLAPPEGLVDVVLDADGTNEIDDQFTIAWALLRPDRLCVRALHAAPYSHARHLVSNPALVTDLERRRIDALVEQPQLLPRRRPLGLRWPGPARDHR